MSKFSYKSSNPNFKTKTDEIEFLRKRVDELEDRNIEI